MSITSRLAGYFSLGKNTNKVQGTDQEETVEGVVSELIPELELSMSDEDLAELTGIWKKKWSNSKVKADIEKKQKENENYWLGKQFEDVQGNVGDRPLVDNLIFEALEQALPVATKQNPEPVVSTDNTDEGTELAGIVQKYLVYLADILCLKLKMKKVTRYWAIYFLGVAKISWSLVNDEIATSVLRPQKLYLDPEATIDETGEYTGEFIGEVRKEKASNLVKRFPKKKKFIESQTQKENATELQYVEWWTDDYVCWEMDGEILGKAKNPHFNHEGKKVQVTDEMGQVQEITQPAQNHFPVPKKPYIFLSIFNLGKQPFDDTSLITQNLPIQDLVNKRFRQIDKNADKMNGGGIFSSDNFTSEQASEASRALRDGGAVLVPGDVNRAYKPIQQPPLPGDIFTQLEDSRRELKDIFGVTGLGAGAISKEQTVRGKILTAQADTSRIGGGISEYLEQFADHVFNWYVQMMYVYYDQPHKAAIIGQAKADEEVELVNTQLNRKLVVSVKDGSLIPKDSLTQANQAVDLATAGLLDPITLFKRLDFPNPQETAKNLLLWKMNPMALFPDLQKEMQQQSQQAPQPQGGNAPDVQPQGNPGDKMAAQATPSLSQVPINQTNSAMPQ